MRQERLNTKIISKVVTCIINNINIKGCTLQKVRTKNFEISNPKHITIATFTVKVTVEKILPRCILQSRYAIGALLFLEDLHALE